ncbi:molybdenum cofactor cytidylyltransferase [Clostridium sediminicola]|uniref:molybdenum cofactor cytidylyltransferase n=1 Tax=Clostridium sediminicola TaxID=3114879 RepID=UPI0031F2229C
MINAIIMASGLSRRMGSNKLLLKLNGKYLVQHIIDKINNISFHDIIIVTSYDDVFKIAEKSNMKYVINNNGEKGISESIKLGIVNSAKCDGYMFFTGDQPLVSEETIIELMDNFNKNEGKIIIPVYDGFRGSPVVFPSKFKGDLLSLEGDKGGKSVINNNLKDVVYVSIENGIENLDIDTVEDYENILKHL